MIRGQLAALRPMGIESLAICLLHGFAYPAHEQLIAQDCPRSRLHGNQRIQPGGAAGENRCPRRHDGDGCLFESRAANVHRRIAEGARRQRFADSDVRPAGWLPRNNSSARTASSRARRAESSDSRAWRSRPDSSAPSASTWGAPAPTFRGSTAGTIWNTKPKNRAFASSLR